MLTSECFTFVYFAKTCYLHFSCSFYSNTYTNKTWSEFPRIPLTKLNKMEREFLLGVDFQLYVDKQTYESWLNLLKGLVHVKESEVRRQQGLSNANRARVVRQRAHQYHQDHPIQDAHQYPYQHQNQDKQLHRDSAYLSHISGAIWAAQQVRHACSEPSTAYMMSTGQH